ncbi:serine/threonine-protein kinase cbk1 [Drepanopeziza brunnea f. sp. 'multigermtubi' MB_m1]|uniref:non-specific serine/threonine protein kinase n=1 Tax=Marssonina brunnea f. sp. multigermtubi (strain MB_m1) TaxID=1072389 RepID=K1XSM6_MARBU|nr:serine/threonine-protein kinase cbk1 [Drepanopeziza brunnea f. sp. 'multigermtubi' MB_m1]EKD15529.1 serine/threonine-protein kinase cbk1 [Drepanopeziza brunnea f. sp. 'multigermtubi' MB_m1]
MKRTYSFTGHIQSETPDGDALDPPSEQGTIKRIPSAYDLMMTPPASPESPGSMDRPSKLRRHGSKLLTALKSFRNSVSNASMAEAPPSPVSSPARRLSAVILKCQLEPTVVHRTQFNNRPSLISIDKGATDVTPEGTPSTSTESRSNSGKSSVPRPGESTSKTSLDSKLSSQKYKMISQHSSENKKVVIKQPTGDCGGSNEHPVLLAPIVESLETPEPAPTIITVERAAAAKVFFETHYNQVISGALTPRSMRRRQLEAVLYHEQANLSPAEQAEYRRAWAKDESDHLRETRVMKARAGNALREGKDITTSRYEVVKVLGKGSFGVVRLVREKEENSPTTEPGVRREIYAMKVIRKSDMLRNSQEGHLRAERDFLVSAEGSRWVVPLIASFQDLHNLYLVMDYMPGGDFLGLLIRDNVLSEAVTKWYIAEMILCIEEAHALRWIHRDVKPDNFLISASGHLKISDFGLAFDGHWSHDQAYFNNHRYSLLAKLGIDVAGDKLDIQGDLDSSKKLALAPVGGKEQRHEQNSSIITESDGILNWRNRYGNRTMARSVVGTSQYMAPEVVRGDAYDARCDWWSVAVILYECLYGHTPFLAEEGGRQQTKQNIIASIILCIRIWAHKNTFAFPHKPLVSKRCQDLIRSIIQEKETRLCSRRYRLKDSSIYPYDYAGRYVFPNDAEDIKSHKWFRDIQWDRLHTSIPPFVPDIKSLDDTHYFDEEDPISDFSDSNSDFNHTAEDISKALRSFNNEIKGEAIKFVTIPHDSLRLKKFERWVEDHGKIPDEQKEYLKDFARTYGQKEKKRPRDRLLRDKDTAPIIPSCVERIYERISKHSRAKESGLAPGKIEHPLTDRVG